MPIPPVISLRYICIRIDTCISTHKVQANRVRNWSFIGTTDYFNENILFRKVHSNKHELYIKRTSVNSDG